MKKLSILLITYNHEKYIRQAVESILLQVINFEYEVILADDGSTDGTQAILKEYAEKYPDIFKSHFSEKNLGITKNYQRAFKLCSGEYVAVLEGDDYWCNTKKLDSQIKFLDQYRECVICFHRFWLYDESNKKFTTQSYRALGASTEKQFLTIEKLIRENFIGNFSTCLYRNEKLREIDDKVFDLKSYDWMVNMTLAQKGLIGYLPETMSVYRIHSSGSWSSLNSIDKINETINAIKTYNHYFNDRYSNEFSEVLKTYQSQLTLSKLQSRPLILRLRSMIKKLISFAPRALTRPKTQV